MDQPKPLIITPEQAGQKTWIVVCDARVPSTDPDSPNKFKWESVEEEIKAFECQTNGGVLFFRDSKGVLVRALAEHMWTTCVLK